MKTPTVLKKKSTELLTIQSTESLETVGTAKVGDSTEGIGASQNYKERIMNACRNIMHWRLLVDLFLMIPVILSLAMIEIGIIPHHQIGFYCNDPKIAFKFTGETISTGLLIGGCVSLPLIVMWTVEWICHKPESYRSTPGCTSSRGKQVWAWYGQFTVGIIALLFIIDIAKILIGEPRPHFLDTCRPREIVNCTDQYISTYTCTNTEESEWFKSDSSKSFPSGHSALSMFTTTYIAWYLQNRMPRESISLLLKPWLQCMSLLWGLTCSLTRISDNRHHWWDVLVGVVAGVIAAVITVKIFCRDFVVTEGGVSRALCEPIENGHIFDDKRHQSVRKLLSNASVDIPEGRELRDVSTPWKE